MSAVPKFPWPLSDTTHGPNAELRSRFLPDEGAKNGPAALTSVVEAPTKRLRQNEQLESVGRLAGGVAHDFNNLLTGVLLYCDLILAADSNERVRRYTTEIRNAGIQATGLVRQLLAVAKPMSSDPRLLSLNEIAEGLRNLLARLIGENIELQFRLNSSLGLVRMDPTQAQQILLNLVLNARDAMPGGGVITVETSNCRMQIVPDASAVGTERDQSSCAASSGTSRVASLPCVLFVVEDNGAGMDAATRAHLFEAFFTTKPTGKGTGLGLATVHDIVTGHGGLIHVESALGRGTRITVLLPPARQAEQNPGSIPDTQKIEGELPALEAIRKGIMP